MDDIEYSVKKIISEQLGLTIEKVENKMLFTKSLGADSIDIIELIMSVEEYFNIEIGEDEIQKIFKVQDIIDCVIKHNKKK